MKKAEIAMSCVRITRRHCLQMAAGMALATVMDHVRAQEPDVRWYEVSDWGVEGRGWPDEPRKRYFDRFPAKAETSVPPAVWSLSRHSAGMAALFTTDASQIYVEYELFSERLEMPHMPATGVSGLDLYARAEQGLWRWVQVVQPRSKLIKQLLVAGIDAGPRTYMLYLPLYNGVERLRLGVPSAATFSPVVPRTDKPIVFYGTSIMQGACASRPGMALPALVGRYFDVPTINLGFSGNGRMDPPVVELLAELDAEVFCIDCLPNMQPEQVRQRTGPLVRRLREAHPRTPILLVEDRVFANARFYTTRRRFHEENHAALYDCYKQLQADGVERLYYLHGNQLLGEDGEATTDGSHPNDLGFVRYAEAYIAALKRIRSAQG
jgi:hypothetical protein